MALQYQLLLDLTEIDDDGDVVPVVGSPPEARLLVCSSTLRKTSPVFKAMIDGEFREGRSAPRSTDASQEVALPDDSGQAVSDMCDFLHHND